MKCSTEEFDRIRKHNQEQIALAKAGKAKFNPLPTPLPAVLAKPSKYRNVKTLVDGITFDSKREANYYVQLKARRDTGQIKSFIPQVSLPIGKSKRRLRLDFLVIHHDDRCEFVDAKGMATDAWKIKRDEFEANYLVKVVTV